MVVKRNVKEAMVKLGVSNFQNADAQLPEAKFEMKGISRGMTPNWFVREVANKEQLQRTWLMYSPIKEAAFYLCCMLFPPVYRTSDHHLNAKIGLPNGRSFTKLRRKISTTRKISTIDNPS